MRVFSERGYGPTTIAAISAEAGLSRAAFYVYFASKAEVFRVLAVHVRDAFISAQEAAGADPEDPPAVARAAVGAFVAAYARHLSFLVLFEQQAPADEVVADLWAELQRRPLHRHAKYIRRLQQSGEADPVVDPLSLARAVGAMCTAWAPLVAADSGAYDDAVHDVTTMYLHMLRLRPRAGDAVPGGRLQAVRAHQGS